MEFGVDFAFLAKLEIKGEEFCLGPVAVFSENEEGIIETTYLASYTNERDNIQDYGWVSLNFFGAKLFDFDASSNEIITGQAALNGDLDDSQPQMDTQWSYNLDC